MKRNREYAQLTDAPLSTPAKFKTLWYNTIFYMTVFGLFGGLLAWGCGEMLHFKNSARVEASKMLTDSQEIRKLADAGKITPEERASMLEQMALDGRNNPYYLIYSNDSWSEQEKAKRVEMVAQRDAWKEFISNVLAFGVSGMIIAFALSIADPIVSRNIPSAIISGSVGATLGLIGGVVVALFAEKLYQSLAGGEGQLTTGRQILARVVQWSVVGAFLTLASGMVMRNSKKLIIGMLGGAIGGAVGGVLFDLISHPDMGRLVGLCSIGLVAGAATGLIENAAKSGWLKVTHGLIAGKQFILYRNPTFIGASPDNQIFLFKDPQVGRRHAAVHIVKGGFELEDLPLGAATCINGKPVTRTRLRNGDQVQVGATRFVFQEKQPSNLAPGGNGNGSGRRHRS
jgi:hypothetical protein